MSLTPATHSAIIWVLVDFGNWTASNWNAKFSLSNSNVRFLICTQNTQNDILGVSVSTFDHCQSSQFSLETRLSSPSLSLLSVSHVSCNTTDLWNIFTISPPLVILTFFCHCTARSLLYCCVSFSSVSETQRKKENRKKYLCLFQT